MRQHNRLQHQVNNRKESLDDIFVSSEFWSPVSVMEVPLYFEIVRLNVCSIFNISDLVCLKHFSIQMEYLDPVLVKILGLTIVFHLLNN